MIQGEPACSLWMGSDEEGYGTSLYTVPFNESTYSSPCWSCPRDEKRRMAGLEMRYTPCMGQDLSDRSRVVFDDQPLMVEVDVIRL